MASKFQFKVLNGTDPNAQYAAIATPDALTFYLLSNGVAYLGSTPLFGGNSQKTVVKINETISTAMTDRFYLLSNVTSTVGGTNEVLTGIYMYDGTHLVSYSDQFVSAYISSILVTNMLDGFTPDNDTIATTKALYDYVQSKLTGSGIVSAAFFRAVTGHTITQAEYDAAQSDPDSPYAGHPVGDVGLLFTADTDDAAGGETYYYVSLANYAGVYGATDTNSIHMTLNPETNTFAASLNIKAGEASILADENGVYLNKTTSSVNDALPSDAKLVSEAAVVNYFQNQVMTAVESAITNALRDVVTYTVEPTT
jgi:hypothetical protein